MNLRHNQLGSKHDVSSGNKHRELTTNTSVLNIEKRLLRKFLEVLGNPRLSVAFWDGSHLYPLNTELGIDIIVHDRAALWRFLINPKLNFAENYRIGRIEAEGGRCCRINIKTPR